MRSYTLVLDVESDREPYDLDRYITGLFAGTKTVDLLHIHVEES